MSQILMKDDEEPDVSQISNQSFLTSLDDNELIDFINKLSQKKQSQEQQPQEEAIQTNILDSSVIITSDHQDDLLHSPTTGNGGDLPPSSPKHSSGEQALQLAQQQPTVYPSQDTSENDQNVVFGDYGTYFAAKSKAQQAEDEQYLTWDHQRRVEQGLSPELPPIFEGCIIHVNGHTRPGIQTLHKLIILYGGKFLHHLSSKGSVTHVIASRLTPRKEIEFKNYKVVKPEWITESIEKGKKLNWSDYSVIKVDYGQKRLPFEEQGNEEPNQPDEEPAEDVHNGEQIDLSPLTQEEDKPLNDDVAIDEAIDARHPDFLKIFFAKSRLHHLSTWKSDLRAEFLTIALNQTTEKKFHKEKSSSSYAQSKVIMHVDFDCFFATASALKHPEIDFKNTPVCVSYGGNSASSSADVASCNYVCRKFGVKNGMWVRSAKRLCPELVCLDYDFPTYEKISKQFYNILVDLKPDCIFPVSIDEALLDVTSLVDELDQVKSVEKLCSDLRSKIYELTKCSVSTGCSHNVLLAKLALRRAKPEGQFYLHNEIAEFLRDISIRDLPGTGYSIQNKLIQEVFPSSYETEHRVTISHLLKIDKSKLIKVFGVKTGTKLYDYARGRDDTSIDISENPQEFMRKSVSIDVNWGIRFDTMEQVDKFLFNLGKEMSTRLNNLKMCAFQMTLKILKRAKDAPIEPPKYLGCGKCDALSKSSRFGIPTDEFRVFGTEARSLFRNIGCDPIELRGVSISVAKLVPKDQVGNQKRLPFKKVDFDTFKKQKLNDSSSISKVVDIVDTTGTPREVKSTQYLIPSDVDSSVLEELPSSMKKVIRNQREKSFEPVSDIPKDVDLEVFKCLPADIQAELKEELRRRKIQINPQTPQKDRKAYLQQVFPIDGSQPEYVRIISPRKSPPKKAIKRNSPVKRSPSKSPIRLEKYDENILNELPTSLRENIIEEWEAYENANQTKFSKLKENLKALAGEEEEKCNNIEELTLEHFDQLAKPLVFQKRKRPREIMNLVEQWIIHTKHKGPHSKDLKLFRSYIESLLEHSLVLCLNLIESIELLLKLENGICVRWVEIFQELKELVHGYCKRHKYKV